MTLTKSQRLLLAADIIRGANAYDHATRAEGGGTPVDSVDGAIVERMLLQARALLTDPPEPKPWTETCGQPKAGG